MEKVSERGKRRIMWRDSIGIVRGLDWDRAALRSRIGNLPSILPASCV